MTEELNKYRFGREFDVKVASQLLARTPAGTSLIYAYLAPDGEIIAVAPGGGKTWGTNALYKQWSPERFAEAANRLTLGHEYKILLIGDRAERALLQRVSSLLREPGIVAAGESLERVSALLLRSRLFLGNDGGLLHLANALGIRSVSIYGPVDAAVYGPYGKDTSHVVVSADVECRPCYKQFRYESGCTHRDCLQALSVEEALRKITDTPFFNSFNSTQEKICS